MLWLTAAAYAAATDPSLLIRQGAFEQALPQLRLALAAEPDNARLQHLLGRCLLALEKPQEAQPYLRRAVELEPHTAEFHFWLGVDWWALLDFDRERDSYLMALRLDPNHLPARLYLAHNAQDRGEWETALSNYRIVLSQEPAIAEAHYNVAVALERLGRWTEAMAAWQDYFALDATSPRALTAAEHLNARGDFTYRIALLGAARTVLPAVRFEPGSVQLADAGSHAAIERLGAMLRASTNSTLKLVVHAPQAALASKRALAIRDQLGVRFPDIAPTRLRLSGSAKPEIVTIGQGDSRRLHESVSIRIEPLPTQR